MKAVQRRSLPLIIAVPVLIFAVVFCSVSVGYWNRRADIQAHFDRAEGLVQQAKGPEAKAEWEAVLKKEPDNVAAHELLAEYYFSRQNWAEAAKSFARLYQLAPAKPHLLCKQAASELRLDDQKGAYETAQREQKHDPDCVAALGLMSSLMAQRPGANAKELLTYLRRLATLQPDDVDVHRMFAEALSNQYMYDELRPVVANILRLEPNDAQAYNLLGFADLARADQPQGAKDAIKNFQKSLELATANPGAHFGLGRAYIALKQPHNAVNELETAARDLGQLARLHKELATAYRLAGQKDKANVAQTRYTALQRLVGQERTLMVRCAAYPDNPDYPYRLGALYLKMGNPLRALYYLQQADKKKPNDPEITALLAQANKAVSQPTAATIPGNH